jgi:hypothetical protein
VRYCHTTYELGTLSGTGFAALVYTPGMFLFQTGDREIAVLNPLNPELNPICHLLAFLEVRHFLHVSSIRVKSLILRLLMVYIQGVSKSALQL